MQKTESTNTPFLKLKEAAKVTGLSEYFLRRGCKDGSIPCVKSGPVYMVNVPLFLEQLDELSRRGGAAE